MQLLALIAAIGLGSVCCEGDTMHRISAAQYPPDFHYITKQEIRTTMGQLAMEVSSLDAILSPPGGATPEVRDAVLDILRNMRALAAQLKQGSKSSHPLIDRDATRLRREIERAIDETRMTSPPIYYQAGRVVGACTYCHAPRHEDR
jgi:hypothetical protein